MATNPAASANGLPDLAIYQHLEHAALRGLSPSTLYKRLRLLAAVRKITGAAQLTEVTAAQLTAWRAGLEVDEHSVRTYVSHVRQFFAWAQDQGLRPDNPAARLPVPRRARLLPARSASSTC